MTDPDSMELWNYGIVNNLRKLVLVPTRRTSVLSLLSLRKVEESWDSHKIYTYV